MSAFVTTSTSSSEAKGIDVLEDVLEIAEWLLLIESVLLPRKLEAEDLVNDAELRFAVGVLIGDGEADSSVLDVGSAIR